MDTISNITATPQGLAMLSAAIGASAALLSQLVAGALNLLRDLIMERIRSKRRAKLAAIFCASELEIFKSECSNAYLNWELVVNPNDIMDAKFQSKVPAMILPGYSELEFLDAHLLSWVFRLRSEVDEIERTCDPQGEAPPDYGGVAEKRRDAYENMAQHASFILDGLRKRYELPTQSVWPAGKKKT